MTPELPKADSPEVESALAAVLAKEQARSAFWGNRVRVLGLFGWLVIDLIGGGIFHEPHQRAQIPYLCVYLVLALVLAWARERRPWIKYYSFLAVAVLDVPMVYLLQRMSIGHTALSPAVPGFAIGVLTAAINLSQLTLRRRIVYLATAAAAAAAWFLAAAAGLPPV